MIFRLVRILAVVAFGLAGLLLGALPAAAQYSVEVVSVSATAGATDVQIPIKIGNTPQQIQGLYVPLEIRAVTPGSFVSSIRMSWADRISGGVMDLDSALHLYPVKDGAACPFYTTANPNGHLTNTVTSSPIAVFFERRASFAVNMLPPGIDASGSLVLTVDLTTTPGEFEIDTICTAWPSDVVSSSLGFVLQSEASVVPSFTKGTITILPPSATVDSLWVAPGGVNAPGGGRDPSSPLATIPYAFGLITGPRGVVQVAPGTYTAPVVFPTHKSIELRATDGPFVTTINGLTTAVTSAVVMSAADSVNELVLDGFTITGNILPAGISCTECAGGITVGSATNASIINCIITGNSSFIDVGGIEYSGHGGIIANNWIVSNRTDEVGSVGGLSIAPDAGVRLFNNTIAFNIVPDVASIAGVYAGNPNAITKAENNIIAFNSAGYGMGYGVASTGTHFNNLYFGNGVGNAVVGIRLDSASTVVADPRFVNGKGPDVHLTCQSPALNAGTIVPVVDPAYAPVLRLDIDGQTRPTAATGDPVIPDIGADEFHDNNAAAGFAASTTTPCLGQSVTFDNLSLYCFDEGWTWDFGDGTPLVHEFEPSHVYSDTGIFTVSLILGGPYADTAVFVDYIEVIPGINADFTANVSQGCVPLTVTFSAVDYLPAHSFTWIVTDSDGGDTISGGPVFPITFTGADVYTITLIVADNCSADTIVKEALVTALAPVTVSFAASQTDACVGQMVDFVAEGDRPADSIVWDFGGQPIVVRNLGADSSWVDTVSVSFNFSGVYSVELRAYNACGVDVVARTDLMTIRDKPSITVFSSHDSLTGVACAPYTVNFYATSNQPITSYLWDFGDNSMSTDSAPSHIYTQGGSAYSIRLIATGECGVDTIVRSSYIGVEEVPTAGPTVDPLFVCAGNDLVAFDAHIVGPVDSVLWDFGNGATSTLSSGQYSYPAVGEFEPTLTVYHVCGEDVYPLSDTVTVSALPIADFVASPDSGYEPHLVNFTNLSANIPTAYLWRFGDGDSSVAENPDHTYGTGVFTVILNASNQCSEASETKTDYIHVGGFVPAIDSIGASGDTILYTVTIDSSVLAYDRAVNLTASLTPAPRRGSLSLILDQTTGVPPFTTTLRAVQSAGLATGDYMIELTADDPTRISKTATRSLHYEGVTLISVTPAPVVMDSTTVGFTSSKFLTIKNTASVGTGMFLSLDDPGYTGSSAIRITGNAVQLSPQQSVTWGIAFSPSRKGDFTGTIHILSDDPATPDSAIAVTGRGIGDQTPPKIASVFPDSLAEALISDTIRLEFSRAMIPEALDTVFRVRSAKDNADVPGARRWVDDKKAEFIPDQFLPAEDQITVTMRAVVMDTNGNRLDGNSNGTEQGSPDDDFHYMFLTGPGVWPGDTDDDGVVNEGDILPIGRFWGMRGNPRPDPQPDFSLQPAFSWNPKSATYADADGSGVIDSADICPIVDFFDQETALPKAAIEAWMAEAEKWPEGIIAALRGALVACPGDGRGREVLQRFLDGINTQSSVPQSFHLAQNYPNPFNARTVIEYTLKTATDVSLEVFDLQGHRVKMLDVGRRAAGRHTKIWDGTNAEGRPVSSGIYFYRLVTPDYRYARKMILLK